MAVVKKKWGYLEFQRKNGKSPRKFMISKRETTLGTALASDIRIIATQPEWGQISCVFTADSNGATLENKSQHDIIYNGSKMKQIQHLKHNDLFTIGGNDFRYCNNAAAGLQAVKKRQSAMPAFKVQSKIPVAPTFSFSGMKRRSLSESKPKTASTRRSCMTALPKRKIATSFGWQTSASSNCIPAKSNVSVLSKNTPKLSASVRKSLFLKNLQKSGQKSQENVSMELLEERDEIVEENFKKTPPAKGVKRLRRNSGSSSGSVVKCLKKLKPNEKRLVFNESIYGESSFDGESCSLKAPSTSNNHSFLNESLTSADDSDAVTKLLQCLDTTPSERRSLNRSRKSEQSVINISSDSSITATPNSPEIPQRFSGVTRKSSSQTASVQTPISIDLNVCKSEKKTPNMQKLAINFSAEKDSEELSHTLNIQTSPLDDLSDVKGVKKVLKTPKGVKALLKTPKVLKSPNNDLSNVKGDKKLLATPKIQNSLLNDLTDSKGRKQLLKTPKYQKSLKDDPSSVEGVKKLMKTPKVQKTPLNDLRSSKGLKQLLKTPKANESLLNDLTSSEGMEKVLTTPKVLKSPKNNLTNVKGVENVFATENIQKSPMNDITNLSGVNNLMMTPEDEKSTLNSSNQRKSSVTHKPQLSSTPFDKKLSDVKDRKTPSSARKSLDEEILYVSSDETFDSADEDFSNISDYSGVKEVLKTSDRSRDRHSQSRSIDQGSFGKENEQVTFTIEEIDDKLPKRKRSKSSESNASCADVSDKSTEQERDKTPIKLSNTSISSLKISQIQNSPENHSANDAMPVFEDMNISTSKRSLSKQTPRSRQKSLTHEDVSNISIVEEPTVVNSSAKKKVRSLRNSPRTPLSDSRDVNKLLQTPKEILEKFATLTPTESQEGKTLDEDFDSVTVESHQQSGKIVYNENQEMSMLTSSQEKLLKTQNIIQNDYSLISDISAEFDSEEEATVNTTNTERRTSLRTSLMQNSLTPCSSRSRVVYEPLKETPEKDKRSIVTRKSLNQQSIIIENLDQTEVVTCEGRKVTMTPRNSKQNNGHKATEETVKTPTTQRKLSKTFKVQKFSQSDDSNVDSFLDSDKEESIESSTNQNESCLRSSRIRNLPRNRLSNFDGVKELLQTPKEIVRKVVTPEGSVEQSTVLFEHPSVERMIEQTEGEKTPIDSQSEGVETEMVLVKEDTDTSQRKLSKTPQVQQNSPDYIFNISDVSQTFDSDEEETVNSVTSLRESSLTTSLIQNSPRKRLSDDVGSSNVKDSHDKLTEQKVEMTNSSTESQILDFTEDYTVNASPNESLGSLKSSRNRNSNLVGVKELLQTPKDKTKTISSPRNSRRYSKILDGHSSNLAVDNIKEIRETSTPSLRSPRIRNSSQNSISNCAGVKGLPQTPINQATEVATLKQSGTHSKLLEDPLTDTIFDETEEVGETLTNTTINNKSINMNTNHQNVIVEYLYQSDVTCEGRKAIMTPRIEKQNISEKSTEEKAKTPTTQRKLSKTPRVQKPSKSDDSDVSYIPQCFDSDKEESVESLTNRNESCLKSFRIRNLPRNRLSNFDGVRELLQTPKEIVRKVVAPEGSLEQSTVLFEHSSVEEMIEQTGGEKTPIDTQKHWQSEGVEREKELEKEDTDTSQRELSKTPEAQQNSLDYIFNIGDVSQTFDSDEEETVNTVTSLTTSLIQNSPRKSLSDSVAARNVKDGHDKLTEEKVEMTNSSTESQVLDSMEDDTVNASVNKSLGSLKSLRNRNSPRNRYSNLAGVKELLQTPKDNIKTVFSPRIERHSKMLEDHPTDTIIDETEEVEETLTITTIDNKSINMNTNEIDEEVDQDLNNLEANDDAKITPTKNNMSRINQLSEQFQPEVFKTPIQPLNKKTRTLNSSRIRNSPRNRLSDLDGIKELLQTPKRIELTPRRTRKQSIKAEEDSANIPMNSVLETQSTPTNTHELEQNAAGLQNEVIQVLASPRRSSRTPRLNKEPHNDMSNISGIAGLFASVEQESIKTPIKVSNKRTSKLKASSNQSTPYFEGVEETLQSSSLSVLKVSASKNYSRTSRSQELEESMSDGNAAFDELLKTPSSIRKQMQNDVTRTLSSRRSGKKLSMKEDLKTVLLKTPRTQNEPQNDLSDVTGIVQLHSTPIQQLNTTSSVEQKPAQSTPLISDFEEKMLATSKEFVHNSSTRSGIRSNVERQKSFTTLVDEKKIRKTSINLQSESKNRVSDFIGVKELLATPRQVGQAKAIGRKTPKGEQSENVEISEKAVDSKQMFKGRRVKVSKSQKAPRNDLSDISGVAQLFDSEEKEVFATSHQLPMRTITLKTVRFKQSSSHNLSDVSSTKELIGETLVVESPIKRRGRSQKAIKKRGRPAKTVVENDEDDTNISKRVKTIEKVTDDADLFKLAENVCYVEKAVIEKKETAGGTRRQRKVVIAEPAEEDESVSLSIEPVISKRGRKRNQGTPNVNVELPEKANLLIRDNDVIDVQRTLAVEDKLPSRRPRLRNKEEVDESGAENTQVTTQKRSKHKNETLNDESLNVVEVPKPTKRGGKKQAENIKVTEEQKEQKLEVIDKASKPPSKRARKPHVDLKNAEEQAIDEHISPKLLRKRGKKQDSSSDEEKEVKRKTPKLTKTRGKKQNTDLHNSEDENIEKKEDVTEDSKPTRKRVGNRLGNLEKAEDQKEVEDTKVVMSRRGRPRRNIVEKNTANEKPPSRQRAQKKVDTTENDVEVLEESIEVTKKPTRSTRQKAKNKDIEQTSINEQIQGTNDSNETVEPKGSLETIGTDKKLQLRRRGRNHKESLSETNNETEVVEVKKSTKRMRGVKNDEESMSEEEKPTKRLIGARGQKNKQESEVGLEIGRSSVRQRGNKNKEENDGSAEGTKIDVENNKKSKVKRGQKKAVEEEVEIKVYNTRGRR